MSFTCFKSGSGPISVDRSLAGAAALTAIGRTTARAIFAGGSGDITTSKVTLLPIGNEEKGEQYAAVGGTTLAKHAGSAGARRPVHADAAPKFRETGLKAG